LLQAPGIKSQVLNICFTFLQQESAVDDIAKFLNSVHDNYFFSSLSLSIWME
jgi:hypothetical protein